VGTYAPPFRSLSALAEDDEVLRRIEAAGADLLWVGLGGPKQEFWMAEHRQRIRVPVMLGVGAAFDFHTGNRPWAPAVVRRLGLEWAWRMLTMVDPEFWTIG
jgi:N-acetylglucosaminyldiphosphoundecaprenol N-acetyl-beta-D-mannosaminyltransferase